MQIALVDPSRTVRRIVTDLVRQWNYDVSPFSDGAEALSFIQQNDSVRVLMTSAELPSLSGLDLCARVRHDLHLGEGADEESVDLGSPQQLDQGCDEPGVAGKRHQRGRGSAAVRVRG